MRTGNVRDKEFQQVQELNWTSCFTSEEQTRRRRAWLTARSGTATHPAKRDLEGVLNTSQPEIFIYLFFNFFKIFYKEIETIHPESACFYV